MYKIRVYPGSDSSLTRDSGSESTPLLSSESRTSPELVIFDDSDTSDLDPSPTNCSLIYGSIDSSYNTILTTPKRPISSTKNSELFVSTMANSPCTVSEKNCEPCNVDLTLMNENSNTKKAHEIDFVPLQFQPDIIQASCKDLKPKQSSLVTIFSIWNTILGSSLLTMPWGIMMAGFFPGIILNLLMSGLCLYTAYRLIVAHAYHGGGSDIEVLDLCRIYLGKWAEHIARIFSIAVLLGATVAYWILMANFLYNSINFIYDSIAGWSTHRVSENISYKEVLCPKDNNTIVTYEKTYDVLGPAWDLRNTVPMDLTIAYFLVTLTYIIVGVAFFMCFPLPKSCIEDNLLNNFQKWDGLTIGARIVLLFQLVTVYPLLAYMLRIQLLSWIWKRASNRGLVLFINLVLVSICIIFATFVPYIGTIVRYTGALSGLIYVFTFPNLLHLSILKKEGKLGICSILFHLAIPVIGFSNLIAQFFITDR
ncbi:Putative sodium-coupled neutral amino acid transporter 9 [Trachymyrmex cornetzi]|uniref:Putative sodium-coupled neutral amino acid transporter 9 n=1 Tax=Trachymyrmex cornetzi TaxID=471704 RepID=A0A151J713_9HYME|nr:Putative sodium-coupled neutral amino acid transporter 9 [Trachymyrmex cornetzi]